MKRYWISGILGSLLAGCLSTHQTIPILEGESVKPYDSLGSVEVKIPSSQLLAGRNAASYKKLLHRELRTKSAPFGPEALIHVKYWPDLSSENFPSGFVYARAEMVRFQRFLAETEPPAKS